MTPPKAFNFFLCLNSLNYLTGDSFGPVSNSEREGFDKVDKIKYVFGSNITPPDFLIPRNAKGSERKLIISKAALYASCQRKARATLEV